MMLLRLAISFLLIIVSMQCKNHFLFYLCLAAAFINLVHERVEFVNDIKRQFDATGARSRADFEIWMLEREKIARADFYKAMKDMMRQAKRDFRELGLKDFERK